MTRQKAAMCGWACGLAALVFLSAAPASAQWASPSQTNVTASDIQRLQDQVYEASSDVTRLRRTDGETATRLQTDLDDLRDEVVYLKVKLRKEGNVGRTDYNDVRDRLQDLRSRARGENVWRPGPVNNSGSTGTYTGGVSGGTNPGASGGVYDDRNNRNDRTQSGQTSRTGSSSSGIPVGQELDVRLQGELSSANAQVEQRFEATTITDLFRGSDVLIPAGSVMRGVVSSVDKATRTDRKGSMTVAFDQITVHGRNYPIRATVTQAIESQGIKGEAARIGTGGAVGAIIGGIIGGVKGALLGVLIGGGGTIAATEGKDVTLPPGTILRVRLDQPPTIR